MLVGEALCQITQSCLGFERVGIPSSQGLLINEMLLQDALVLLSAAFCTSEYDLFIVGLEFEDLQAVVAVSQGLGEGGDFGVKGLDSRT